MTILINCLCILEEHICLVLMPKLVLRDIEPELENKNFYIAQNH